MDDDIFAEAEAAARQTERVRADQVSKIRAQLDRRRPSRRQSGVRTVKTVRELDAEVARVRATPEYEEIMITSAAKITGRPVYVEAVFWALRRYAQQEAKAEKEPAP